MLRLKTSIVAWSGSVWATDFEEFTMTEILDAHMNNYSEHYGELCLHSSTLESNCWPILLATWSLQQPYDIVSYSAEVSYFMDKYALKMHADEIAKSALVFDDNNIELFSENHVLALRHMKRVTADMAETTESLKQLRIPNFDPRIKFYF
ncbi:hypothetical protein BGX24_008934 [Mortierella sp. AD032]|nr:hypothetical protein BGX24_008934 [Mortierella sp. AD032]